MKLRKLVKMTAIGFAILGLAACASNNGMSDSDTDASGAALGPEFGFQSPAGLSDADLLKRTSYYFNFNSVALVQTNLAAVEAQGRYLSKHSDQVVLLEGNADIRGSREYNIGLGWRRDLSVAQVLMLNGVAKSQIHMVSYGAEKPVALGNTALDYAKNRRVDIVYCKTADCKTVYNNDAP
ncbi:MAG: OmpA family protein, partial [Gammaproteobacteria bacterium]|nr:OmpA family protein [Gammaproteobacteria bacterium]